MLTGMQDGDGQWVLGPGAHALYVRCSVSEDLAQSQRVVAELAELANAQVWVGELESRESTVVFTPRAKE